MLHRMILLGLHTCPFLGYITLKRYEASLQNASDADSTDSCARRHRYREEGSKLQTRNLKWLRTMW
jgi:hypothetical protein